MRLEGIVADVSQAPKLEPRIMRYELTDYEWTAIKPMLPNKPRGEISRLASFSATFRGPRQTAFDRA
jgi:hypothetical protein